MATSQLWSTGSLNIFVKLAGWAAPLQLGTFEGPPEITLERAFKDVKNDLFGSVLPADRIYEGKEAMISGTLNRFSFPVLLALQGVPIVPPGAAAAAADVVVPAAAPGAIYQDGSDTVGNYGALMTQQNLGAEVWCLFPRWATQPGMIPGYHFLSAFLQGPDKIRAGSSELQETVIFKCQRKAVSTPGGIVMPAAGQPVNLGLSLNCYDHAMTALAGVVVS